MTSKDLEQEIMRVLSLAMDQPSDQQIAWVEEHYAAQPEIKSRVLKLLQRDGSSPSLLRTGGASADVQEPEMPERAGNYLITELMGQGGMGAVYKGRRDTGDFEHVAAIKVVRPGLFSEALTARFERERQTLAGLNHSGIARLFDGGTLADGSPYIIMELVDGISLARWIDSNPSDLSKSLGLFEQICDAVSHAHQNLIIHRDLTPSNVLVTKEDTIKLIDFGIAKPQSIEEAEDGAGSDSLASLSFTPGFAAPERGQGAPANTLSDVYSLGKLLQALLKNSTPDPDLKAIIDRASAMQPQDRYGSALALRDDVRNYRTGYPVNARSGSASYRFGKYLRRRKLLVGFAAASVLALTGALGVTLFQYQRAETALEQANVRFDQARDLSRSLVFETYDEFAQVSGTLEPRRNLANVLSTYVDQLAEDKNAPEDVLFDVGQMNSRLADLYGGVGMANLGDTDKSYDLLTGAELALSQLVENDPENTDALAELVMVERGLTMQHLIYRLSPEKALEYNERVLASAARGAALADENERTLLRHFWSGRTDRLQVLLEMKDYDTALSNVRAWRPELTDEMFERLGGGEEMAAYLAVQEAEILIEIDRPTEALDPLSYAEGYRQTQLELAPENYYQQTQLMVVYMETARAHDFAENSGQALVANSKAVDLARTILAQDPSDAGGPEGLNSVLQNQASFLFNADRIDEAITAATEALGLARQLDAQFPDDPYYQRILMNSLKTVAEASPASREICPSVDEAATLYDVLSAEEDSAERNFSDTDQDLIALRSKHGCAA